MFSPGSVFVYLATKYVTLCTTPLFVDTDILICIMDKLRQMLFTDVFSFKKMELIF